MSRSSDAPQRRHKLRCAVYTRKSSEEGLEQEFNSLDAQREACEAYVASQRAEGWLLVPDRYDDGGFSGGTLERPALKRLRADIEASGLSKVELTAIWNALPGTTKLAKFKDRKTAAQRLWAAFAELPVEVPGSTAARAGSKQAQVIDLFRRAEGATVAEVIAATGWQPHTVRGIVSGTLKKKLGLTVLSAKEERGRVYRIPAQAGA